VLHNFHLYCRGRGLALLWLGLDVRAAAADELLGPHWMPERRSAIVQYGNSLATAAEGPSCIRLGALEYGGEDWRENMSRGELLRHFC
jgi:hypothetical protein